MGRAVETICEAIHRPNLVGFDLIADGSGRIVEPHALGVGRRCSPCFVGMVHFGHGERVYLGGGMDALSFRSDARRTNLSQTICRIAAKLWACQYPNSKSTLPVVKSGLPELSVKCVFDPTSS
jgi:hypothetical protein